MQKARPIRKKDPKERFRDDPMYHICGEQYIILSKGKHDRDNTKPSVDNNKVSRPRQPSSLREPRELDVVSKYTK